MATVSVSGVKKRFIRKFPELAISEVLSTEPEQMNVEEFLAKVGTWLSIMDTQTNKYHDKAIIKEVRR